LFIESISVPASVEVLRQKCFAGLTHLSSLSFESGSKLRAIEKLAFENCRSLKSISLPSSLKLISGASFANSSIERIVIDESNSHYFVSGDFLVAFDGMTVIRYFGHSETVIIVRDIEALDEGSFSGCKSLVTVAFEEDSRLTRLGVSAFSQCSALKSICIPIQVEYIDEFCFSDCTSLVEVRFEKGSKLTQIGREAFAERRSLRLFVVPARLSILEWHVFYSCNLLSQFVFGVPSTLRRLDLPTDDFVSICIPDSMEILMMALRKCVRRNRFLEFGRESRLITIYLNCWRDWNSRGRFASEGVAMFIWLSEGAMRRLRCNFEAF
jgi:hypothetical protein